MVIIFSPCHNKGTTIDEGKLLAIWILYQTYILVLLRAKRQHISEINILIQGITKLCFLLIKLNKSISTRNKRTVAYYVQQAAFQVALFALFSCVHVYLCAPRHLSQWLFMSSFVIFLCQICQMGSGPCCTYYTL